MKTYDLLFYVGGGIVFFLYIIGVFFDEFLFLKIPFMLLIFSLTPALVISKISLRMIPVYIKIHKFFNQKNYCTYRKDDTYSISTSRKQFTLYNTLYSFGFVFATLRLVGLDNLNDLGMITLVAGMIILSIIFASAINGIVYILKKLGIMFENKSDGTRINLGNDLSNRILPIVGPLQIIFVTISVINTSNFIIFLISLIFTGIICCLASLFSHYILEKKQEKKLLEKAYEKLKMYLN